MKTPSRRSLRQQQGRAVESGEDPKWKVVRLRFFPSRGQTGQVGTGDNTKGTITHSKLQMPGTDQHAPPPEAHHAQAALEGEAVVVRGCDARFEGLAAADAVGFLGLPLRIVHPLHVFP